MKRIGFVYLFWFVITSAGCCLGPIHVKDSLSKNEPKGYAAFMAHGMYSTCDPGEAGVNVYEIDSHNKYQNLGHVSPIMYGRARGFILLLRVAGKPGPHLFHVRMGNNKAEEVINIKEGFVIPVHVDITCTDVKQEHYTHSRTQSSTKTTYYGHIEIKQGPPIAIEKWEVIEKTEEFWLGYR